MRITLTLDPDVAVLIERELRRQKATLKAIVNQGLRRGFALEALGGQRADYRLPKPLNLGNPLLKNLDNIGEILELLDSRPSSTLTC